MADFGGHTREVGAEGVSFEGGGKETTSPGVFCIVFVENRATEEQAEDVGSAFLSVVVSRLQRIHSRSAHKE